MITIELSDKEIEFVDDTSNDIMIVKEIIPFDDITRDDLIEIHYTEDEDDISHRYTISNISDDRLTLRWVNQLNEDVLTEANPFTALKNKLKPDQATKLANAADKAEKKSIKKTTDLLVRDVKDSAEHNYKFYLQLPDGTYTKDALAYKDIKHLYAGNHVSPAITNAIVVTQDGWMVRQGKKDLDETGTKFSRSMFNIPSAYEEDWTKDDISNFKGIIKAAKGTRLWDAVKAVVKNDTSEEDESAKDSTEETPADAPKTQQVKSNKYSDAVLDKAIGIFDATGVKILDSNSKEVKPKDIDLTDDALSTYKVIVGSSPINLNLWLDFMIKQKYITESCDISKFVAEGLINESPIINLDKDDLFDPKEIDLKHKVTQAVEKEKEQQELSKKEAAVEVLKTKYVDAPIKLKDSLNSGHTAEETLEVLFDILVPSEGPADSAAGELVRAMMRILYRDANDGDKFFEGYGIETCGSSAEYLFDNGFAEDIQNMIDHAWQLSENDEKYTDALDNLTHKVIHHIDDNNDLFYTVNEEDSREYSNKYIVENQPTYEFELYGSDDIDTLVEKGVLTSWDLTRCVEEQLEWEADYRGAEAATPWSHHDTSVTVINLTKDGYDRLKDSFEHDPEGWWKDLTSEYSDELSVSDYDDDYDIEDESEEE